jgi:hypothetical protein
MAFKYLGHDQRYAVLRAASIFAVRHSSDAFQNSVESAITRTGFKPSCLDPLHPSTIAAGVESTVYNRLRIASIVADTMSIFNLSRRQAYHIARATAYGFAGTSFKCPRFKGYKLDGYIRHAVITAIEAAYKSDDPDAVRRRIAIDRLGGDFRLLSRYFELAGAGLIGGDSSAIAKYIGNWDLVAS